MNFNFNFLEKIYTNKNLNSLNVFLFLFTIALLCFSKNYHEPWRDELHSLCISLEAKNPFDLFYLRRYEGHPYVYYFILYLSQIFGKSHLVFIGIHLLAAILVYYFLYFKFSIPNFIKCLLPFNYYLIFEFGTLNRLYIFLFLFYVLAIYYYLKNNNNLYLSFLFLVIAAHTHVQAIPVSFGLATAFLFTNFRNGIIPLQKAFILFFGVSILLFLSYLSCVPPADCYNKVYGYIPSKISKVIECTGKVNFGANTLLNWTMYDFWNNPMSVVWYLQVLNFIPFIVASCLSISKKNRYFFIFSTTVIFYMLLVLNTWGIRHYCFIWINLFLFYLLESRLKKGVLVHVFISVFLILQSITGLYSIIQNYKFPFSNCKQTADVVKSLKPTTPVLGFCNYMVDGIAYYIDQPIYFMGNQQLRTYTEFKFNDDIGYKNKPRFMNTIHNYLNKYKQGYLVIFKYNESNHYINMLENSNELYCQKVFETPLKSLTPDEDYVILKISKKQIW